MTSSVAPRVDPRRVPDLGRGPAGAVRVRRVRAGGDDRRPRDHSQICQNIYAALRQRLKGTGCTPLGPDAGVATIGDAIRYPDALMTCTKGPGTDRLVPGVVVVFEVVSPTSGRIDRIDKLREYRVVPTIRRYVILEHTSSAISV